MAEPAPAPRPPRPAEIGAASSLAVGGALASHGFPPRLLADTGTTALLAVLFLLLLALLAPFFQLLAAVRWR